MSCIGHSPLTTSPFVAVSPPALNVCINDDHKYFKIVRFLYSRVLYEIESAKISTLTTLFQARRITDHTLHSVIMTLTNRNSFPYKFLSSSSYHQFLSSIFCLKHQNDLPCMSHVCPICADSCCLVRSMATGQCRPSSPPGSSKHYVTSSRAHRGTSLCWTRGTSVTRTQFHPSTSYSQSAPSS